jgi:hypothetical protein
MKEEIAKKIIDAAYASDDNYEKVREAIETIEDATELSTMRKAIAMVISEMYIKVMMPIFKEYPHLDRD